MQRLEGARHKPSFSLWAKNPDSLVVQSLPARATSELALGQHVGCSAITVILVPLAGTVCVGTTTTTASARATKTTSLPALRFHVVCVAIARVIAAIPILISARSGAASATAATSAAPPM